MNRKLRTLPKRCIVLPMARSGHMPAVPWDPKSCLTLERDSVMLAMGCSWLEADGHSSQAL